MENIRVYRMNESEWWASPWGKKETHDFYIKTHSLKESDSPIELVTESNIDNNYTWDEIYRVPINTTIKQYEKYGKMNKPKAGDIALIEGHLYKYISFRTAIEQIIKDYKELIEPIMLCGSEY